MIIIACRIRSWEGGAKVGRENTKTLNSSKMIIRKIKMCDAIKFRVSIQNIADPSPCANETILVSINIRI